MIVNKEFMLRMAVYAMLAISPLHYSAAAQQYLELEEDVGSLEQEINKGFYIKGFSNIGTVGKVELNPNYTGSFAEGKKVYSSYGMSGDAKEGAAATKDYYIWPIKEYEGLYNIFKGGGAAIGFYTGGNFRLELEGALGGAKTQGQNTLKETSKENPRYFAQSNEISYFYSLGKLNSGAWAVQHQNKGFNYAAGTLNIYYDFALNDIIQPYVGAGAGLAKLTFQSLSDNITYPAVIQGKLGATFITGMAFTPYVSYKLLYLFPKETELRSHIWGSGKQDDDSFPMEAEFWKESASTIKMSPNYLVHNLEIGLMISL